MIERSSLCWDLATCEYFFFLGFTYKTKARLVQILSQNIFIYMRYSELNSRLFAHSIDDICAIACLFKVQCSLIECYEKKINISMDNIDTFTANSYDSINQYFSFAHSEWNFARGFIMWFSFILETNTICMHNCMYTSFVFLSILYLLNIFSMHYYFFGHRRLADCCGDSNRLSISVTTFIWFFLPFNPHWI